MPTEMIFDPDLAEVVERVRSTPVRVADVVEKLHPLVKRTADSLCREAKAQKTNTLVWASSREPILNVGVGRETIDRAVPILEALVRGLENAGFHAAGPTFEGHGMKMRFRLREKTSQVPHKPKRGASELDRMMAPKFDYVPNGILGIEIGDDFNAWSTRRSIWETEKMPLEDWVPHIPLRLLHEAQEWRNRRAVQAETERRKAHEAAQERRMQELLKRRQERDEALFQLADRWQRCTNLRGLIDAVRQVAVEEVGAADANPGLSRWLAWAGRVAERHDPLTGLRQSSPRGRGEDCSSTQFDRAFHR